MLIVRKLSPWKIDTKNNFLTGLMIQGEQAVHGISKNTKFVEFDQKKSIKLLSKLYRNSIEVRKKFSRDFIEILLQF